MGLYIIGCSPSQTEEGQVERNELFRPQFHFTPPSNWMNDPNGMVYLDGEYHLFYQHNPNDKVWGPMHWGHAISKDLVHWEDLPIALYPDSLGTIFSGSAVYDHHNTSGLGNKENPPLVAIFTHHDGESAEQGAEDFQTQSLAYSTDKGRTWVKYTGNPVLPNPGIRDFRDPKVHWHEASQKWVMALAVQDVIHFYSSPNLINWMLESTFGKNIGAKSGVWECPDLFPVVADDGSTRYVLLVSINPGGPNMGSATQYFVGDFDGKDFTSQDSLVRWLDYGPDNYAGVTWSNLPSETNGPIFLGWMSNWQYANATPTAPWRSAMTVPRTLSLEKTSNGYQILAQPLHALNQLRGERMEVTDGIKLNNLPGTFEVGLNGAEWPTVINIENSLGETLAIRFDEDQVVVDRTQAGLADFHPEFARTITATMPLEQNTTKLMTLLVDHSSVELFVDAGRLVLTTRVFPQEPYNSITVQGSQGWIYPLQSIWPKAN